MLQLINMKEDQTVSKKCDGMRAHHLTIVNLVQREENSVKLVNMKENQIVSTKCGG